MAEGEGGAVGAGAAVVTGGEGAAAGAAAGAAPEWLGGLPDDLRGDATLGRFADVQALARGFIETKKLATSKLAVPAADAAPEAWDQVWNALGRPEKADGYGDFGLDPLPATADDKAKEGREAMLGNYRDQLHRIGVPPKLAGEIVKADLARIAEAERAFYAKGDEDVAALKAEMGKDYEPKLAAAKAAYARLGLPVEFADALDTKVGSGALIRGMMKLAELTGEHGRVEGDAPAGQGGDANAAEQLKARYRDKSWREKLNAGDATTVAEQNNLMAAAKRQGQRAAGFG